MEELLVNDMVYQHRVEQANERANHYLELNPSETALDESKPDPNNTDQDVADANP